MNARTAIITRTKSFRVSNTACFVVFVAQVPRCAAVSDVDCVEQNLLHVTQQISKSDAETQTKHCAAVKYECTNGLQILQLRAYNRVAFKYICGILRCSSWASFLERTEKAVCPSSARMVSYAHILSLLRIIHSRHIEIKPFCFFDVVVLQGTIFGSI